MLVNKELESLEGTGAGGLPVWGSLHPKFLGYFFIYFVWGSFWVLIPAVVLGWRKSVVLIKVPGIAFRFAIFDQNRQTHSLLAVEVFHHESFLCFCPSGKQSPRSEKEVILNKLSSEFL